MNWHYFYTIIVLLLHVFAFSTALPNRNSFHTLRSLLQHDAGETNEVLQMGEQPAGEKDDVVKENPGVITRDRRHKKDRGGVLGQDELIPDVRCTPIGDCFVCDSSQQDEAYCSKTGKRQQMKCQVFGLIDMNGTEVRGVIKEYVEHISCDTATIGSSTSFWVFEGVMLGLLGISSTVMVFRRSRVNFLHQQRIAKLAGTSSSLASSSLGNTNPAPGSAAATLSPPGGSTVHGNAHVPPIIA